MDMGLVLRLLLIIGGVVIFFKNLFLMARKHIGEEFSVPWTLLSVLFVLTGIFIHPYKMETMLSWPVFILILIGVAILIAAMFLMTGNDAEMNRRIIELEMQTALLNEENIKDRKRIRELEKMLQNKEEAEKK